MEQIEEREHTGGTIVIRPPEALGISRTEKDPAQLERVYQIGRSVAEDMVDQIRRFLA